MFFQCSRVPKCEPVCVTSATGLNAIGLGAILEQDGRVIAY